MRHKSQPNVFEGGHGFGALARALLPLRFRLPLASVTLPCVATQPLLPSKVERSTKGELPIFTVYAWLPVQPFVSVAVIVKLNASETVGVPVIAPVAESRAKPSGRSPALTENVTGATPPV